jgi:hypothetical protein
MLSEEPEYSLPFEVVGLFNLVGCTLIDGEASEMELGKPLAAVKEAAAQMLDDVVAKYRERAGRQMGTSVNVCISSLVLPPDLNDGPQR